MVNWRIVDVSDASWDQLISSLPHSNIFQSSAWARHKSQSGWKVMRAIEGEDSAPKGALQALMKTAFGFGRIIWSRGGPLADAALWNSSLQQALVNAAGGHLVYARICSYREETPQIQQQLTPMGWHRPNIPFDRNMTYLLDLTPDVESLKEGLSSNWRHNLKRGNSRAHVNDWHEPDYLEMENVYRNLEALKGLGKQHRAQELKSMCEALGPALLLKRAVVDGRTVAFRACAVFGEHSVDLLAAATDEARKVYASYALLWSLILESKRRGAKFYDLGGADPEKARGVADFKNGVGAKLISTIGEWEFASPPIIRQPTASLISWKLGKSL